MSRYNKFILIFLSIALIIIGSTVFGYILTNSIENKNSITNNLNELVENTTYPITTEKIEEDTVNAQKITPSTIIQYNVTEDGIITNSYTEPAKYSLVNLTLEELKSTLGDTEVVSFDENLVILESENEKNEKSYIVGTKDGFVTIFYEDEDDNIILKDETKISVENLPEKDKKLLQKGIRAKNEAELAKIIEDYTS